MLARARGCGFARLIHNELTPHYNTTACACVTWQIYACVAIRGRSYGMEGGAGWLWRIHGLLVTEIASLVLTVFPSCSCFVLYSGSQRNCCVLPSRAMSDAKRDKTRRLPVRMYTYMSVYSRSERALGKVTCNSAVTLAFPLHQYSESIQKKCLTTVYFLCRLVRSLQ